MSKQLATLLLVASTLLLVWTGLYSQMAELALALYASLKPIDDKSSPISLSKYDNLPDNIEIVDYCDVISSYLLSVILVSVSSK